MLIRQIRTLLMLWRPALLLSLVMISLGACVHWDPVAEKVIPPPAATAPQRTAQPQSPPQAHSLAAQSN